METLGKGLNDEYSSLGYQNRSDFENETEFEDDLEDTLTYDVTLEADDSSTTTNEPVDVYDIFFQELFQPDCPDNSMSGAHKLLESINKLEFECRKPSIRKLLKSYAVSNKLGDIDSLVPYVKTRWTYSVLSFERALLLGPCLLYLMKEGLLSSLLDEFDLDSIKVYIVILKPFQTITSFFSSAGTTARYLISALTSYRDTVLPHIYSFKNRLNQIQLKNSKDNAKITTVLTQIERFLDKIKQYVESYEKEKLLLIGGYFNCGYRNSPYLMQKLGLEYEESNNKKNNELLSRQISESVAEILFPMLNLRITNSKKASSSSRIPGIMSIVFDDGSESFDKREVDEEHYKYIFRSMVLREVQSFNAQYNKIHLKYTEASLYEGKWNDI